MSGSMNKIVVCVRTGDIQGGGTDANVAIILHDIYGAASEKIKLDNFLKNDFERGRVDLFQLPGEKTSHLAKLHKLEIFRDDSGIGSTWFVEKITLEDKSTGYLFSFPVFRWLRPHYHYVFREHDTSLPQDDEQKEQRKIDLEENRKTYEIDMTDLDFPAMVKNLPAQEEFSNQYQWDLSKLKFNLIVKSKIQALTTDKWKTVDDIKNIYKKGFFPEPKQHIVSTTIEHIERANGCSSKLPSHHTSYPLTAQLTGPQFKIETTAYWSKDWFFGYQRLNGPVPNNIRLCTRIPERLAVKEEDLTPFLEGYSVQQAIDMKKIFACDLGALHGIKLKARGDLVPAPIVLLYSNLKNQLLPIAIQLYQEPSTNNPVFFPSDDKFTWLLAKMWYNHAETTYHQALTHLGFTHLMMEGVCLALHRNVSVSHPVFKILAPHLLYLLSINNRAVKKLLAEGEWIDKTMPAGRFGVIEVVKKGFSKWRLDIDGSLPDDLKERGVYDKDVLPDYHYRDDALLFHEAIQKYVDGYVNVYYDSPSKLQDDVEIQAWSKELKRSRKDGGMSINGIQGNGEIKEVGQLVHTLTSIIFTCSVQHAAVNFPQYDYYGFPPVYPVDLGENRLVDKKARTEQDLVKSLPDKGTTFDAMVVTTILSNKNTNSLGDFELQYITDPKAMPLVERFRQDLKVIGDTIVARNKERSVPYDYLHPDSVPNAISI